MSPRRGAPDILVNNNAGPPLKDFRDLDAAAIDAGLDANMVTPIRMTQRVVDGMAQRGFGRIVCITSASVKAPVAGSTSPAARGSGSPGSSPGWRAALRRRHDQLPPPRPVRNAPARRRSRLRRDSAEGQRRGSGKPRPRRIPAGRFGDPDEFGRTCAFLCSAHAGFITGQSLLIHGGGYPGVL
ncbi:SDR family oxidoreductase [Sphingomonas sp. MMS24-JH45]